MNDKTEVHIKQRIVGAIVLVSLGVIVIPMLLDGGKEQQQDISNSNIPILPSHLDKEIVPVAKPKPKYLPKPITVRPVDEKSSESVQPEQVNSEKSISPVAPPVRKTTQPVTASKTQAKSAASVSESQSISSSASYTTASKPATTRIDTAYTIQVGSFSSKTNAFALRDKLRKDRFKAYVESVTISAGIRYRVRVGPFLKYAEVEQNRDKLLERHKLKGAVVKYSS